MSISIESLNESIVRSNSVGEALQFIQKRYEIDYITFHLPKNEGLAFSNPFVRTTYPDAWVRKYLRKNYFARAPAIEQVIEEANLFVGRNYGLSQNTKRCL